MFLSGVDVILGTLRNRLVAGVGDRSSPEWEISPGAGFVVELRIIVEAVEFTLSGVLHLAV